MRRRPRCFAPDSAGPSVAASWHPAAGSSEHPSAAGSLVARLAGGHPATGSIAKAVALLTKAARGPG